MSFLDSFLNGDIKRTIMFEAIKKRPRAIELGKKECVRCGICCLRRPCIPTPSEIKNIAKYLNIDLKKMVRKYFVGEQTNYSNTVYIFPANKKQKDITGKLTSVDRSWDTDFCIFYDKKKRICKIYSVRPKMAKTMKCWIKSKEKNGDREIDRILDLWAKEKNKLTSIYGLDEESLEENR